MARKATRMCVFSRLKVEDSDYGCMGEFVPGKSDSPYCPRCRTNEAYWTRAEKKRPGAMRRYRGILACRHARLNEWNGLARDRRGNVIHIETARRHRHG